MLASTDPAIVAWAKQHSPTMSIDAAAPSFIRQDHTFDADAFIAYAIRRATEIAPDALPMQISITDVSAIDKLLPRPSWALTATFIATSRAARPPGVAAAAPWDGFCLLSIGHVEQLGKTSIMQVSSCPAATGQVPSCKIAEVLTQARAQGLAANATVTLVYGINPEPNWQVAVNAEALFTIPDKCGIAAERSVPPLPAVRAVPESSDAPVVAAPAHPAQFPRSHKETRAKQPELKDSF